MLRRLHPDQPQSFAFTPENRAWAEAQMLKYPPGRQASAIIPLLFRAQAQEGWLTRPAIEAVADMLGLSHIRALEVATFYFMFHLQPVGSLAHVQVCGTLSCMIMGAEDLIDVCKSRIAPHDHQLSADGRFSWEEVECLGACANAPMVQIGKDYYEDLTPESLTAILDEIAAGRVPVPGPQNGRYAAEPRQGLTSLTEHESGRTRYNATVSLALDLGDTIGRIDGTEEPLVTPWVEKGARLTRAREAAAQDTRAPDAPAREPVPKAAAAAAADADKARVKDISGPASAAIAAGGTAVAEPGAPVASGVPAGDADADGRAGGAASGLSDRALGGLAPDAAARDDRTPSKPVPKPRPPKGGTVASTGKVQATAATAGGAAAATGPAAGAAGATPATATPATPASATPTGAPPPAATATARAPSSAAPAAAGSRPAGLPGPRGEGADNLKEIEGIGPVLERLCHDLGVYHFDQIAAWGPAEIAWMDGNLKGFRGRVTRDRWVAQARLIVAEGLEAFRIRARTNDY